MKAFFLVDVDNGNEVLESNFFEFQERMIRSTPYHRVGIQILMFRIASKHKTLLHSLTLRKTFIIPYRPPVTIYLLRQDA